MCVPIKGVEGAQSRVMNSPIKGNGHLPSPSSEPSQSKVCLSLSIGVSTMSRRSSSRHRRYSSKAWSRCWIILARMDARQASYSIQWSRRRVFLAFRRSTWKRSLLTAYCHLSICALAGAHKCESLSRRQWISIIVSTPDAINQLNTSSSFPCQRWAVLFRPVRKAFRGSIVCL